MRLISTNVFNLKKTLYRIKLTDSPVFLETFTKTLSKIFLALVFFPFFIKTPKNFA